MLRIIPLMLFLFLCSFLLLNNETSAQEMDKVRISPKAEVGQYVGLTNVHISYSRPGVKERKIWGGLVPYDKVWRAGADEATKFTFEDDVEIEGKKLPKGSYSFFAIPTESEWTLILNKVADQWGAFEYNESEDAMRFKVKPEKGNYEEWLRYSITRTGDYSAVIRLEWENLKVPFKIKTPQK